jgi:hypothetical protein
VQAFLWFWKGLFKIQILFALCKQKPLAISYGFYGELFNYEN